MVNSNMAVFSIENMKIVLPSPDNFILKLDLKNGSETKSYNFIASGEHIYENQDDKGNGSIDPSLLNKHLAHSSLFNVNGTVITAFSLFDMNDLGITTYDGNSIKRGNEQIDIDGVVDNLLLMPNANVFPNEKEDNFIPMHVINSNSVYGYIETKQEKSFGFPGYDESDQKFIMTTHNANATSPTTPSPGRTDTITFYRKHGSATNISSILGLGKQEDIEISSKGFDKLFVFDPTDNNKLHFSNNLVNWRRYQSNLIYKDYHVTNNFDNGTLLARAILFPKQTLNSEYSTERNYIPNPIPFNYARKYNFEDDYFYSSGKYIVLNHRDDNKFTNIEKTQTNDPGGTMVTSTYSNTFGDVKAQMHKSPEDPKLKDMTILDENGIEVDKPTDYNQYKVFETTYSDISSTKGLFNQYTPEIFNRENETMSDTALMTSKHKANIFDIQFPDLWGEISKQFRKANDYYGNQEIYDSIRDNLKKSIRTNLYKLVDELKPAHTHLYKIKMDDTD